MKHTNPVSKQVLNNIKHNTVLRNMLLTVFFIVIIIHLSSRKVSARDNFFIERPKLGMDFSFEYEKDIRTGPFTETENIQKTYTEHFDIETVGWVYHPALLVYTLELSPEWEQKSSTTGTQERRTTRPFLLGFFSELTFLQYKPYTLILSANRDTLTTRSNIAERSVSETDTYSARLLLKYNILPSSLSFIHIDGKKEGLVESENRKNQLFLNMRHDKYLGTTVFSSSFIDSSDTIQSSTIETKEFKAGLTNVLSFSEEKDKTLSSIFSHEDKHSTNNLIRRYYISENFSWQHRDNLRTTYKLNYDKSNYYDKLNNTSLHSELKSLGFNMTHTLYENLTTLIDINAKQHNTVGGRSNIYGPRIDWNYKRNIPWGVLGMNAGFDYQINDNKPKAEFISVRNEAITLNNMSATLLDNEDVNINSIIVKRDIEGTQIYTRDLDYRIIQTGSFTGIRCLSGGDIDLEFDCDDGADVFVDYDYRSPSFDYSSFGQSYGINLYLWEVWRIFYKLNRSKQKFISGLPPEELAHNNTHIAGTAFEWKWNKATFDWEDHYTTTLPIRKWKLNDTITLRPNEKTFLSFSVNYGITKYKDTMDIDKILGLRSGLQLLVSERGYWNTELFFNKTSGTDTLNANKGITSSYEWSFLIYTFKLTYEFHYEDDEKAGQTLSNNYFLFNIKRTLF